MISIIRRRLVEMEITAGGQNILTILVSLNIFLKQSSKRHYALHVTLDSFKCQKGTSLYCVPCSREKTLHVKLHNKTDGD